MSAKKSVQEKMPAANKLVYNVTALALAGAAHDTWTRVDKLTPQERSFHEAHLSVTMAIGRQVQYLTRKMTVQDEAIQALIARVERLEEMRERRPLVP